MRDLIDRQAAINTANTMYGRCGDDIEAYHELVVQGLKDLPPGRKKGKWLDIIDDSWAGGGFWKCSCCGYGISYDVVGLDDRYNYCHYCGAKMEEKE